MKKERPPCEGGPPQQNIAPTLPLGVNGSGVYLSAVTASTLAIEAPANLQAYSPGNNGDHQTDKLRKPTYYRMCVDSYADIDPRLDDGSRRLLGVMLTLKNSDGIIIAGKEKLAFYRGKSPRRIYAYFRKLCAAGYLRLVKKGGGYPGNADAYSLGEMYTQEKAEWCAMKIKEKGQKWAEMEKERWSEMTSFEGQRWSAIDTKAGNRLPTHPIGTNTHTQDPLLAFTAENWKRYCLELNPRRDPVDIDRSYDYAIAEGARDGYWKHLCRRCDSYYRPSTKPQAPAAIIAKGQLTPAPRPAVLSSCESRPTSGEWFDGLSKEECLAKANGWYGLGGRDNWKKAGCPHLAGKPPAERESIVAELATQYSLEIDAPLTNKASKVKDG